MSARSKATLHPILLLVCLSAAGPAEGAPGSEAAGRVRGSLLIAGGGELPPAILQRFVDLAAGSDLAGGDGKARILVLPMASGHPESGPGQAAEFRDLGAIADSAAITRTEAGGPAAADRLRGISGVWFTGGDQSRVTAAIGDTPFLAALHELYRRGAVIGGSSAGAAIMSPLMITGDERRRAGDGPPAEDQRDAFLSLARDTIVTAPGLGFLPGTIVDQHFVRRKRHNRLLSLVLEHPDLIGVGIDESTALEVAPGGAWSVLGDGVVVIYDARRADIPPAAAGAPPGSAPLAGAGLTLHVLPAGARFEPRRGAVRLP